MKAIDLKNKEELAAAIGFFDGFHLGHINIINKLKSLNMKTLVITFDMSLLNNFKDCLSINPLNQKIEYFDRLNLDYYLILSKNDINQSADNFIKYLEKLNVKKIVCGKDFRFGNDLKDAFYLKEKSNIEVIIEDDYMINDNTKLSSSYLRKLISLNKIELANSFMAFPLMIKDKVIKGKQIGRTIDYKTANIEYKKDYFIFNNGVYFGKVLYDNKYYKAMINIGNNPTINDKNKNTIEVHILNFSKDIYGKEISIYLLKYYRDEIKFDSLDSLKTQLKKDEDELNKFIVDLL